MVAHNLQECIVNKDATKFAKECDVWLCLGQLPHEPIFGLEHFLKWGLDSVCPFKSTISQRILVYFGLH